MVSGRSPRGPERTYAELGRARGIGRKSASALVAREKWRRQKDNRGILRALVPFVQKHATMMGPSSAPVSSSDMEAARSRAIDTLEVTLAAVEQRAIAAVEALREQLKTAQAQVEALEQRLARAERSRDIVIASHRQIADGIEVVRQADRGTNEVAQSSPGPSRSKYRRPRGPGACP